MVSLSDAAAVDAPIAAAPVAPAPVAAAPMTESEIEFAQKAAMAAAEVIAAAREMLDKLMAILAAANEAAVAQAAEPAETAPSAQQNEAA